MPILSLNYITKSFGALRVAQEISFDLEEGEALGIIGPNGAGKSTLFNIITGNIAPDSGTVTFDGRDITEMTPMARCRFGLGRSFQIPQPFSKLTVFENLLVAAAHGRSQAESEAVDACVGVLEATGLLPLANRTAGTLSLLQRKRLELARAVATKPRVLLLDEIAGGLTEAECHALVETIGGLHKSGISIIWIEHVLHALNAIVERIVVLDFGELIAMGPPAEVMASRQVREIYLGLEV